MKSEPTFAEIDKMELDPEPMEKDPKVYPSQPNRETASQGSPSPTRASSQIEAMTNVMDDMKSLLEWVYNGTPKPNFTRGKTFIEEKMGEMEKSLIEKDRQIQQLSAQLTVSDAAKRKVDEANKILKIALVKEKSAKKKLVEKLGRIKKASSLIDTELEDVEQVLELDGGSPYPPLALPSSSSARFCDEIQLAFTDIEAVQGSPATESPKSQSMALVPYNSGSSPFPFAPFERKCSNASRLEMSSVTSTPPSDATMEGGKASQELLREDATKMKPPHGWDETKAKLGVFCLCGLKFSNKKTLASHITYHTSAKFFSCGICKKHFVGTNYLKGHMWQSHKIRYTGGVNGCRSKPFIYCNFVVCNLICILCFKHCSYFLACGKTFPTFGHLRSHKIAEQ